jgi:serine/threonine-protein kinase
MRSLGVAHGWAGCLFALLRWSEATATPPPPGLGDRLDQLASLGRPVGRALYWPLAAGAAGRDSALAASWCNGAAGYVHLWTLAHRQLGDPDHARRAQRAAWAANEGPAAPGDLCCGLAGRAYALLSMYRHSGELEWLARARRLAGQAAASIRARPRRPDSLFYGEVGVALLVAELQEPEHARMPLFEAEC